MRLRIPILMTLTMSGLLLGNPRHAIGFQAPNHGAQKNETPRSNLASPSNPIQVEVMETPEGGSPMFAKLDRQGRIHFVFQTHLGPRYSYLDRDQPLSPSIPIVQSPTSFPEGLEFLIWDLAVDEEGRVHVAIGTNAWKLKRPQDEWGFHFTSLDRERGRFQDLRNLNHRPSEGFSLAVGSHGNVSAIWLADRLFVNHSIDFGMHFAPAEELDSTINPCNCCSTASLYLEDGRLAIFYREETRNERDMYLLLYRPGKGPLVKRRISTKPWKIDTCPMTYYSLTRSSEGLIAAWPTEGQIHYAHIDLNDENRIPDEIPTEATTGTRTGLLLLEGPGRTTSLVWKSRGSVRVQTYDRGGDLLGQPVAHSSLGSGVAAVMRPNGTLVLFR